LGHFDCGPNRMVAIYDITAGTVTSEKHFVRDGLSIAEERDASNNVTDQFFYKANKEACRATTTLATTLARFGK